MIAQFITHPMRERMEKKKGKENLSEVLFFKKSGDYETQHLSEDGLLSLLKVHNLPSRDLKLLLRCSAPGRVQHPAILPRPSSKCVIFLIEHIKMICFTDQCIILTPDDKVTNKFVDSLKNHFDITNYDDGRMNLDSMKLLQQISMTEQDFEHIVLEKAMENVVEKFA